MTHILNTVLLRPSLAALPGGSAQVGSFRKDYEPHWIVGIAKLVEMLLESRLILLPIAGQENEVVKLAAPADQGDVSERFFENDVHMTSHLVGVRNPPQVQPVGVELQGVNT